MSTKKQATKEQIVKSARALLELAKTNGYLDGLCQEGNEVVEELSKLVGIDTLVEKTIKISINGIVRVSHYDTCDDDKDYKVEVTYKGKKITNIEIEDCCEW